MENNKVEFLINMINDMDIKDKLRLAICMSQSKWSGLIYNTKENYEKYNLKEEFIKAKEDMLKNELIKEYVMIQNKVNMLTLQINNRIGKITKKHY